ncbi:MAG: flagellar FliL protein [Alcanivorax sp.]|jgi:flagellar FliL protein
MKKIIIIVVAVLLVVAVGVGAYLMLGAQEPEVSGEPGEEVAVVSEVDSDPIYLELRPEFVVNFEHKGAIRYVQASLQLMSHEQDAIDKVEANMPAVRNRLIMLFSTQNYVSLSTLEGKETLLVDIRNAVNKVVKLKGKVAIDEVFFTSFVIQ